MKLKQELIDLGKEMYNMFNLEVNKDEFLVKQKKSLEDRTYNHPIAASCELTKNITKDLLQRNKEKFQTKEDMIVFCEVFNNYYLYSSNLTSEMMEEVFPIYKEGKIHKSKRYSKLWIKNFRKEMSKRYKEYSKEDVKPLTVEDLFPNRPIEYYKVDYKISDEKILEQSQTYFEICRKSQEPTFMDKLKVKISNWNARY